MTDDEANFLEDINLMRSARTQTADFPFLQSIRSCTPHQYETFKNLLPDYIRYKTEVTQSKIPYQVNFQGSGQIKLQIPTQKRVSKLAVTGLEMPNMLNGITINETSIKWSNLNDFDMDGSFHVYEASIEPANYTMSTLINALLDVMNAVPRWSTGEMHQFICEQGFNGLTNGIQFSSLQKTTSIPGNNPISVLNNSKVVTFTLINHGLVEGQLIYISNVGTDIGGIPQDIFNTSFKVKVINTNTFTFTVPISAYFDDTGGGPAGQISVSYQSFFAFRSSNILNLLGFPYGDSSVAVSIHDAKKLQARPPYLIGGPLTTVVSHWMNLRLPLHGLVQNTTFNLVGTQNQYGLQDNVAYVVQQVIDQDTVAIDVPKDYAVQLESNSIDTADDINRVRLSSVDDNHIGFSTSQTNVINGVIYNAINLSGDTACYLTCREIDELDYWSGVPRNSLCKVQMTDIPGYTIFNSQSTDPVIFPPHRRPELTSLTIELKDIKGQNIDLKNLTMSGSIQIHKDPPPIPDNLSKFI